MQAKNKIFLKRLINNIVYPILAFAILILIWLIAAKVKNKVLILPMPHIVFQRFFELLGHNDFYISVGWSLLRTLISFSISFVIAFLFAILGGLFNPFHKIMSPIVSVLRSAPTMAVILILMIWVDYQYAPIYIGFLIAFPILYSAFYTAIVSVDKKLIEMTKVYKVDFFNKIKYLYLPSISNSIFDVSKSTISLTMKVVIASEVLCYVDLSIGKEMMASNLNFDITYLLAWTLAAIILSFLLEIFVLVLKKIWEITR